MGPQVYLLWSFPRFQQSNNPNTSISNRLMGNFRSQGAHLCSGKTFCAMKYSADWMKKGKETYAKRPECLRTKHVLPPFEVSEEQSELGWFFPICQHSAFGRPRFVTFRVIWEHLSIKYLRCWQTVSYSQDANSRKNYWEGAWWILSTHKWQWRHLEPHRVIFQHKPSPDQAILTSHLHVDNDHILCNSYSQIECFYTLLLEHYHLLFNPTPTSANHFHPCFTLNLLKSSS